MTTDVLPVNTCIINTGKNMDSEQIEDSENIIKSSLSKAIDGQNSKKNHHRRKPSKKKRKWKPYSKLTWQEKKDLEEKEKLRATRLREEMLDNGHPVAPYNTTQFIMAEYDTFESDTNPQYVCSDVSNCGSDGNDKISNEGENRNDEVMNYDNSTIYTDSPQMEQEFLSKDFSETYERVQEESLQTMSKEELMREHIELERTISELQDQVAVEKSRVERRNKTIQELQEENKSLNQKLDTFINNSDNMKSEIETSTGNGELPNS